MVNIMVPGGNTANYKLHAGEPAVVTGAVPDAGGRYTPVPALGGARSRRRPAVTRRL